MLTLSTGSLHYYGLNRIFELAKGLGFEGLEIVMNETYDSRDADYINKLINNFKLPVVALTILNNNAAPKIKLAVEVAEKVGAKAVILKSPLFSDLRFALWFKKEIPKLQKKTSIRLAVENPPASRSFLMPQYSIRNIEDLKLFDYLSLDASHLASQRLSLLRVYKVMEKRLAFVHLSNYNKGKHHQMVEEGEAPLESFLTQLKRNNFVNPISVKYDSETLGGNNMDTILKNLKKTTLFYREYFKERLMEEEKAV